jgi:hypothetical protein
METIERMVRAEALDRQLLGAQLLAEFTHPKSASFATFFQSWSLETTLCQSLIERSIHIDLLGRLKPFLLATLSRHLLPRFWENAMKSHVSQRKPMFAIVGKAFQSLSDNDTASFSTSIAS